MIPIGQPMAAIRINNAIRVDKLLTLFSAGSKRFDEICKQAQQVNRDIEQTDAEEAIELQEPFEDEQVDHGY